MLLNASAAVVAHTKTWLVVNLPVADPSPSPSSQPNPGDYFNGQPAESVKHPVQTTMATVLFILGAIAFVVMVVAIILNAVSDKNYARAIFWSALALIGCLIPATILAIIVSTGSSITK